VKTRRCPSCPQSDSRNCPRHSRSFRKCAPHQTAASPLRSGKCPHPGKKLLRPPRDSRQCPGKGKRPGQGLRRFPRYGSGERDRPGSGPGVYLSGSKSASERQRPGKRLAVLLVTTPVNVMAPATGFPARLVTTPAEVSARTQRPRAGRPMTSLGLYAAVAWLAPAYSTASSASVSALMSQP